MAQIFREFFEAIILALLVFFFIEISIQNFRVEGSSMKPTLEGRQYLMVNKVTYFRLDMHRLSRLIPFWDVEQETEKFLPVSHPPERGDIIVFKAPVNEEKDFVKRVIGLPGERVKISDGSVFIDGLKLSEPYLGHAFVTGGTTCNHKLWCDFRLQEGQYFALGDNRGGSSDSRSWGAVPEENIIGKVWFVYWPLCKVPILGNFLGKCD